MKQKHLSSTLLAIMAFLTVGASTVHAQSQYGTTQYGTPSAPSDLVVNKQVMNPITNAFVENLGVTDATFGPNSEILYQLTIRNTSGQTFNPVVITDTFPSYVVFESGPGTYSTPGRAGGTLTFRLESLTAGETRTVQILARAVDKSALPTSPSVFCVTNTVQASALNRTDSDTAQVCLGAGAVTITTLPIAGFNDLLLLVPFAGLGLTGIALLKKRG